MGWAQTERNLLALVCDLNAPEPEAETAAVKLGKLLRKRGATIAELLDGRHNSAAAPSIITSADYGLFRMEWGPCYKGEMLADIAIKDFNYLQRQVAWLKSIPEKERSPKLVRTLEAIQKYLATRKP